MSQEQLTVLISKLQDDAGLREKLNGAPDLDAPLQIAKDAGFDVSQEACLKHQMEETMELSDDSLSQIAGGISWDENMPGGITIA